MREPERHAVIETLVTAAIVDDARFARGRAEALARREHGDLAIRADLESRGIASAWSSKLSLRSRPRRSALRGSSSADGPTRRVAGRLVRRGFGEASLEPLLLRLGDEDGRPDDAP